jgi:hypothetical protein
MIPRIVRPWTESQVSEGNEKATPLPREGGEGGRGERSVPQLRCVAIHQPYGQVESISGATLLPFLSSTFRDIDLSYLSYISRNVILVWLSI